MSYYYNLTWGSSAEVQIQRIGSHNGLKQYVIIDASYIFQDFIGNKHQP